MMITTIFNTYIFILYLYFHSSLCLYNRACAFFLAFISLLTNTYPFPYSIFRVLFSLQRICNKTTLKIK